MTMEPQQASPMSKMDRTSNKCKQYDHFGPVYLLHVRKNDDEE